MREHIPNNRWMKRQGNSWHFLLLVVATVLLGSAALAQANETSWELRVCADPAAYPFSSQDRPGVDNRIVEILADEMRAELHYVWTPINLTAVRRHLHTGNCDLLMGTSAGADGVLNTVPYYRAPFVFAYRRDAGFELTSMNDDVLSELQIAVNPNGLAQYALSELDLGENVVTVSPNRGVRGAARIRPLMQTVLDGDADVAIVYGPEAAAFAQEHAGELRLEPVAPLILPPLIQMYRILTLGVRPGDEAFRDQLNIALSNRWTEIQEVFAEYDFPLVPLQAPQVNQPQHPDILKVGAVLPLPLTQPAITDPLARAARIGALLAEDEIANAVTEAAAGEELAKVKVLLANSPDAAAARRAAERMLATDGVSVLVGGIGDGQALALSEVAAERRLPFFNIGSVDSELRSECRRTTFNIEASEQMYLAALAEWHGSRGEERWFVLFEGSPEGDRLMELTERALRRTEPELVGSVRLEGKAHEYREVFDAIDRAEPDLVVLLMNPIDQEAFLSRYDLEGLDLPVSSMPFPVMQTREYFGRFLQVAPRSAKFRVNLWDTTLEEDGAAELNSDFVSRSGEPMDPTGWAAYAAVRISYRANSFSEGNIDEMIGFLEDPATEFDLRKGSPVFFSRYDHQLRQPLYVIELDPDAPWGREVSRRIALAQVVASVRPEGDEDHRENPAEGDSADEACGTP